jgi:hypothetical protein
MKYYRQYGHFGILSDIVAIEQDINNRQVSSMNIMEYFFTNEISDEKRWDFIEDFFLGRSESDLIDNKET